MIRIFSLITVALSAWAGPVSSGPAVADKAETRRIAVLVGANEAAPGRKTLRYSHRDARALAGVLEELGEFRPDDIHVLLDPSPRHLLAVLDNQLDQMASRRDDTVLLFYYSGHADTRALYPDGKPLDLGALKKRLEDQRAKVRIGIIDACRGGGWTGTKGLTPTEVFVVDVPFSLDNQGSVLISSSSGVEDAHESETLRGSFFTHHWNTGLRGAADRNQDGRVTLVEAFEYAKALTIRDTAIYTDSPQHPSFRLNLSGRHDLPLTVHATADTLIAVAQDRGPLQLVHLDTGVIILELPPGKRTLTLAVPPGRYLVRRIRGNEVFALEVRVVAGRTATVAEQDLVLSSPTSLAVKGAYPGHQHGGDAPEPRHGLDAQPHSELLLSYIYGTTAYRVVTLDRDVRDEFRQPVSIYGAMASYLWRTDTRWATRIGVGFGQSEYNHNFGGGHSVFVTLGESYAVPLTVLEERIPTMSRHAFEFYADAHVTGVIPVAGKNPPGQLRAAAALGLRLYWLYFQAGYELALLPTEDTHDWGSPLGRVEYSDPQPGLAVEVGLRFVKNFR